MTTLQLKPCPFCKSPDVGIIQRHPRSKSISCSSCGAEGPVKSTNAEAARLWNLRPLLALLLALAACAPGAPQSYSIDPGCSELTAELIQDVQAAYCADGVCMGARPHPDSELVYNCWQSPELQQGDAMADEQETFRYGEIRHIVDVAEAPSFGGYDSESPEGITLRWRMLAHETGHALGMEHTPTDGEIMHESTTFGPFELDASVRSQL